MNMLNPDLSLKYYLSNKLTVQFSLKFGEQDKRDFLLVQFGPPGMTDEQIDEVFDIKIFTAMLEHFESKRMQLLKAHYPDRYKALVQ